MVDGAAAAHDHDLRACAASGIWKDERGRNLLDTGAHFYDVYETADGGYMAVGAIEPQFYAELLKLLGLAGEDLPEQMDREQWPAMKERFAPSSPPRPAPSGRRSSPAATPAWPRC